MQRTSRKQWNLTWLRSRVPAGTLSERQDLLTIAGTVVAGHLAAFSFLFGPRMMDYVLTAYLSAVVVFGALFLLRKPRPLSAWIAGIASAVFIQQTAYRTMLDDHAGPVWSLAQFFAVQTLVAIFLNRIIRHWTRIRPRRTSTREGSA